MHQVVNEKNMRVRNAWKKKSPDHANKYKLPGYLIISLQGEIKYFHIRIKKKTN